MSNLPPPSPTPPWDPGPQGQSGPSSGQPFSPQAGYGPPAWTGGGGQPPARLDSLYYSPGIVILLTIVTCGIWAIVWSYRTGEDLQRYNGEGLGGVVSLVIAIFVSPVLMFTIPNEIEKMYQRDGRPSPVSTLWGLWFLLPLIGNLVWYLKVQGALNDFWTSKGTAKAA